IIISNLQINSMNLDLNSLTSIITDKGFPQSGLTVKKGIITVNKFKVLDLKAKDISSDIQIEKNIVKLSNIAAGAYSGNIEGKIDYDTANSVIDMNITGKGLDIKNSLYDLLKIQDDLEGKYNFAAKLSMITGEYNDVLKSLNGNIKFSAYNGKMGTLGKFEYYLYAQNLLYHGLLNATLNRIADAIKRDNTAKYKQASGTLLFQNGYMLSDGIETTGINMSLYMKGKHNLITNMSNIDIYGRISDEVKSKLGSFGNTSFADVFNSKEEKKNLNTITLPAAITAKIPDLYNHQEDKTNMFKVNIYGNINALNSINSFVWIVPDNLGETQEKLPDFSDIMKEDI
ncbi:MAG: AsmA-like C-terminal region-containing protein, partial [Candidatus Gastranaerophilales bacterium]|nr:AsmA-like C-terminal region-containing protein [Candidatus Gastranaerophilales bacterium]